MENHFFTINNIEERYTEQLVCFLFQMDQLATCMAKETEAQACGPPGQWGLDGDLPRCRTWLWILQQSPGKQPLLAMDYNYSVCFQSVCLITGITVSF